MVTTLPSTNINRQDLVGLLRLYRKLVNHYFEMTNDTIASAQVINRLLVLIEKFSDAIDELLPVSETKLKDSLRYIQKSLHHYFDQLAHTLGRHFHDLTLNTRNILTYTDILSSHLGKTERLLRGMDADVITPELNPLLWQQLTRNIGKLNTAEQSCRAEFQAIKVKLTHIELALNEVASLAKTPELMLKEIMQHGFKAEHSMFTGLLDQVEKAEVQDFMSRFIWELLHRWHVLVEPEEYRRSQPVPYQEPHQLEELLYLKERYEKTLQHIGQNIHENLSISKKLNFKHRILMDKQHEIDEALTERALLEEKVQQRKAQKFQLTPPGYGLFSH